MTSWNQLGRLTRGAAGLVAVWLLPVAGVQAQVLTPGPVLSPAQERSATRQLYPLTLDKQPLPDAPMGVRYTQTFPVEGGAMPYTFVLTGNLPQGMTALVTANTVLIQGAPQVPGDYPIGLALTDALGQRQIGSYVLHVVAHTSPSSPVSVTDTETVKETDGVDNSGTMLMDLEPVKVTDLVSINGSGGLGGSVIDYETVHATDTVTILLSGLSITPSTAPSGTYETAYNQTFNAVGNTGAVTLTPSGALPAGLSFHCVAGACTLSGTPAQTGMFSFSLKAQDTVSATTVNYPLTIAKEQTLTFASASQHTATTATNVTLSVTVAPFTAGTPTGQVTFYDNNVQIGSPMNLSGGSAQLITTLPAGSDTISASYGGDSNFLSSSGADAQPVAVSGSTQTINVGTLPTPTYGGGPFSVSATATSGLPVTITYVSGPATGSGGGPYTITGAGTVNFTATQAGNSTYSAASPVNFSVTIAKESSQTFVFATPQAATTVQNVTLSVTVVPFSSGTPTGQVTFYDNNVQIGSPMTLSGGSAQLITTLPAGSQTISASYAGDSNFLSSMGADAQPVVVSGVAQTINVGTLPTPTYGGSPFSVSATATSGLPVTITRTSGPATGSGGGPYTATGAGTVNFTATQAGNAIYASATPVNFSVSVAKQASVTAVSANPTTITPVQTTTLTATVSAAVTGSPTGTVTFFDNGVPIGTAVPVVGGQAQLTTLLLSGSQAISATYSGDANFVGSSSTANAMVSVAPLDFTMAPVSPVSLNVVPGAAAVVSFNVTPLYPIYPGPVTFSVTGLPSSATYTITPTSVAANGGPQTVTVTIQTAAATVRNSMPTRGGPIALAMFLPLLALGALRRRKRWLSVLVLVLGVFASSAVVGCGTNSGNGFFGQSPQTYPVVITATSGTVQHTINVSLVVQ